MANTIKLNYDCKALASVINYDRKHGATIWSVNVMSSFTIVICLFYRSQVFKTFFVVNERAQ